MEQPTCSVEDCDRPVLNKKHGWCKNHYQQWRRYGTVHGHPWPRMVCSVDGCADPARARGWCKKHWRRWRKTGDPLQVAFLRAVTPAERFWPKVQRSSATDCWSWIAHIDQAGYGRFGIRQGGKSIPVLAHRYAYELLVGPISKGLTLDHTCHTESDCREIGRNCPHRRCVNPAHLDPVTLLENTRRAWIRIDTTAPDP